VTERKPPNVPCGMDDMQDDCLAVGHSEIDIISGMNGETQTGANRVAWHAGMTEFGYAVKMIDDFRYEASRGVDTICCNKIENFIEISVGRISNDQLFRRDRDSPLKTMSDFIVSAPEDLRNSPRL
jgi:hypothetical protein